MHYQCKILGFKSSNHLSGISVHTFDEPRVTSWKNYSKFWLDFGCTIVVTKEFRTAGNQLQLHETDLSPMYKNNTETFFPERGESQQVLKWMGLGSKQSIISIKVWKNWPENTTNCLLLGCDLGYIGTQTDRGNHNTKHHSLFSLTCIQYFSQAIYKDFSQDLI